MHKKRIGVMTWYLYDNYGSMLQAYAICKKIEQLGYAPTLVGYTPLPAKPIKRRWTLSRIAHGILNRTINQGERHYISDAQRQGFSHFREKLTVTPPCNTREELKALNSVMDAFVCGSDQIWSPLCFDENYFLAFVENPQRMIAYAPSIGTTEIPAGVTCERMREAIQRFRYLSVREEQGAKLIRELTGQKAEVVLDPTLLYSKEDWNKLLMLEALPEFPDQYILCYFLGDIRRYIQHVRTLERELNLPVVIIPTKQGQLKYRQFQTLDAGPEEFVSAIKGASFICTDSFHGLVFSLIFQKPFCCYERFAEGAKDNQNSRIYNILTKLNLMEYIYRPEKGVLRKEKIDYKSATEKMDLLRCESIRYLNDALADATK